MSIGCGLGAGRRCGAGLGAGFLIAILNYLWLGLLLHCFWRQLLTLLLHLGLSCVTKLFLDSTRCIRVNLFQCLQVLLQVCH